MRMNTDLEHSEQQRKQSRWGFRGMTVRDWLQLLIVPLALVVIGFLFSVQQDARQQRIENQRAKAERELAVERAQDEALQAYLDQMSGLLLERDLRTSEKGSEVRTLARARTLTVLGRLDPSRKKALMQFLVEADLVQRVDGREPLISLSGATLSDVFLNGANLSGANLSFSDLSGTNLSATDLSGTNLVGADLSDADLSAAFLQEAILKGANLSNAFLYRADLSKADLTVADLSGTDLSGANLNGAERWTEEQLSAAESLERATMPNGQKYEEWLKDREFHKEDGENDGSP
jgi:uncharacterized protein YjbI with pentapeptide repeats